jgi:hypothetical protein
MTTDNWVLTGILVIAYLALMVTAGAATLRKGRLVLLVCGAFLPLLWFVGALLPPKRSRPGIE